MRFFFPCYNTCAISELLVVLRIFQQSAFRVELLICWTFSFLKANVQYFCIPSVIRLRCRAMGDL